MGDDIERVITGRLEGAANSVPPTRPLTIDELRERSQRNEEATPSLSGRLYSLGRSVSQACGFFHHYGGYESDSRITMQSQDDKGIIWSPEDRHAMKAVAVIAPASIAVSYGYILTHYI